MAGKFFGFIVALASVSAAYGVYALTVVPLIEPTRVETRPAAYAAGEIVDEILSPEVKSLFPENAWERTSTKVLETTSGLLLFREYEQLPEGGLKVSPLSIVMRKGEAASRPVLLRADKGAVLQFDEDTSIANHKMGRLKRARLLGRVAITSPATKAGADDAFAIQTSYVQIDDKRIWTGNDVAFRFGPNSGSGRDLTIALRPRPKAAGGSRDDMLASVESLTLAYVERVQLSVKDFDFPNSNARPVEKPTENTPAVLTCRGPFRFDVARMMASFENSVRVEKQAAPTVVDTLTADRLEVHLTESEHAAAETENKSSWEIASLKATGRPAQLLAPSQNATASGRFFEYDFINRQVTLEDASQVALSFEGQQVTARQLVYMLGEKNEIGRLIARGPGAFWGLGNGAMSNATISGNWGDKLQLRPNQGKQVLSLSGGAHIHLKGNTPRSRVSDADFSSDTLHVWFTEDAHAEPTDGPPKLAPEVISALGNVHIETPQMALDTKQLEAFFELAEGTAPTNETDSTKTGLQGFTGNSQQPRGGRLQKFHSFANVVRLNLLRFADATLLERVNLTGEAKVEETQTQQLGEIPLVVTGHSIDISAAHSDRTELHVTGKPAKFTARGVTLIGSNLHANRGYNRLWMTGPGEIQMPAPENIGGPSTGKTQTMRVVYLDGLDFDGQLLRCQREVKITGKGQFALAETMAVELNQKILFGSTPASIHPEAVRFALEGGVFLENRAFEGEQLVSIDRIKGETLTLDRSTGEIKSEGPGWVSSVRRGGGDWMAREEPASGPRNQLVFLRNEFQREMVGNMNRREVEFRTGVRTTYGPVKSWNEMLSADRPDGLGEKGAQMNSDKLRVYEFGPQISPDRRAIEVEAIGNVFIEGRNYSARASRVSFVEAKQMVVLEGDSQSDAELVRRDPKTAAESRAAAQKIKFWPKRDDFHVDDAQYLDLSQLP